MTRQQTKPESTGPNYQIGVWGPGGAGKTLYLGALYRQCNMRPAPELVKREWHIVIPDPSDHAKIHDLAAAIEGREGFIGRTQAEQRYEFTIRGYGSICLGRLESNVLWHDIPGTHLIASKDALYDILKDCNGIFCFIDPLLDLRGTDFSNKQGFYASALEELFQRVGPRASGRKKLPRIFAFVVTKADSSMEMWESKDKPEKALESIVGEDVTSMIQGSCEKWRIFVSSSVGAILHSDGQWKSPNIETVTPPEGQRFERVSNPGIKPFNVIPPMRWMLEQLKLSSLGS